jgi:hypothetical protein
MYRTELLQEIGMGAGVLGLLLLGASAFRARLFGRLRALPLVVAPLWPASVGLLLLSNMSGMMGYMGYLASLSVTLPFFGAALSGWVMLNYHPTERPTADGGAPESVSDVGSNEFTSGERARDVPYRLQRQWTVPRARAGWRAMVAAVLVGPSQAYVIKEKELLEALVWHGKLTAVEAALESSLSVREAELILQALAAKGHLQVTVEHGRLHYSLWEPDAHL